MANAIRAKFKCSSKTEYPHGYKVELDPVTQGSEENEKFFKYTPYGKLEIGTINPEVASQIEVGKEYFIDISLAE